MGKKGGPPKLVYFELGGKVEACRMLLTHAGVKYEDKRLSLSDRSEFIRMKESGELPGGQVPVWIEDGRTMNQSGALAIFFAKKYGYYGKDPWAGYEDDWALDNYNDIFVKQFYPLWFKDEVSSEEIDSTVERFGKWNKGVEAKLEKLGSNFIGGDKPSLGDFVTFSLYSSFVLNENTKVADLRNSLRAEMVATPSVQGWVKRMQEELKDYLASRPKIIF